MVDRKAGGEKLRTSEESFSYTSQGRFDVAYYKPGRDGPGGHQRGRAPGGARGAHIPRDPARRDSGPQKVGLERGRGRPEAGLSVRQYRGLSPVRIYPGSGKKS